MVRKKRKIENASDDAIVQTVVNGDNSRKVVVIPAGANYYAPLDGASEEVIMTDKVKKVRIPPIFVAGMDRSKIVNTMVTADMKDFSLRQTKDGVQIYCQSIKTYNVVLEDMKKNKISHFGHDLSDEKPYRVVLSGLHQMGDNELKNELSEAGVAVVPDDIKVIRPRNPRFKDHVNYILYFKKNTVKLQELKKISSVCYTKVTWEAYRRLKNGFTQCPNCQRPGHGARNCFMPVRCLFCAGSHNAKQCPNYVEAMNAQQGSEETQVKIAAKCANCGQQHFATSSSCVVRQRYIDARKRQSPLGSQKSRSIKPIPRREDFDFDLNGRQTMPLNSRGTSQDRFQAKNALLQEEAIFSTGGRQPAPIQTSQQRHKQQRSWSQQVSDAHIPMNPESDNLIPNPNPFSIEEIMSLTSDVLNALQNAKSASRAEVIKVVMRVSLNYLYYGSSP